MGTAATLPLHGDALRWARFAGEHALPLFLLALVVLLCGAALAWRALHRLALRRRDSALPPWAFVVVRAAAGFAVIVAGAWIFAALADALDTHDELAALDHAFTEALKDSVPLAALHVFALLTHLGDTATRVAVGAVVAVALVARGRQALAAGWIVALAGNGLLNTSLKAIFRRVRPVHDDGLVIESGFSFPSGHSAGAVVLFGMLAYLALRFLPARWHLAVVLIAVALAAGIGASRAFLRVHFASDVVAGFASGAAWLAVCIASIELARAVRRRRA